MTHTADIRNPRRSVARLTPNQQDRVLQLDTQGLRPGQIAYALGLRVGGVSAVCDVLAHYGRAIELLPKRLVS
jgi:DNA-directed RNA polymerase specialized sigma24 family protein